MLPLAKEWIDGADDARSPADLDPKAAASLDRITAAINAGWDFNSGAWRHGPVAALLSQHIRVDDFAEDNPSQSTSLAYPEQTFYGTVTSIATTATGSVDGTAPPVPSPPEEGGGPKAVLVTSRVDNHALTLKPEMTGKAKIYCGPRRLIDLMTRRLARYVRVEFWSWW